ncbi:SRPBCC family protein [Pseudonocardia ailaonensis]|uniref:SRPBCC family protein n=1 Tax=Pseudonocardia ailaonensis TaxID=367279 RepID=A0ABN2NI81_9PSEU
MTDVAPIPPITGTVSLAVPVERAFEVFTGSINSWWPHQFHIGAAEVAEVVLEPRVGGRWYERGVDGTECDWGRVLAWEPPRRLLFTWQINGSWQFDPDPENASEIEAVFREDGAGSVVQVEHRLFERLAGGEAINAAIDGGGGWALLLDGYAKAVADR